MDKKIVGKRLAAVKSALLSVAFLMPAAVLITTVGISAPSFAETYTFGVVPQQSAKKTASLWVPILEAVSQHSGVKLRFQTAKSIPAYEAKLAAGDYNFSYMNPYHYVVYNKQANYQALLKRKNQAIRGILVARKGANIKTLRELSGEKIAFPSPAAFAASVLPRAYLHQSSIEIIPHYALSHDSVYLAVAKGIFVAGGGVQRTLANIPEETHAQLEVIWTTPAYTPHAIAHHVRVPDDVRDKVQTAFIALSSTEEGKALLDRLKIKHGFEAAQNQDWDDIREIQGALDYIGEL